MSFSIWDIVKYVWREFVTFWRRVFSREDRANADVHETRVAESTPEFPQEEKVEKQEIDESARVDLPADAGRYEYGKLAATRVYPERLICNVSVDYKQLARLCQMGCTVNECAYVYGATAEAFSQRVKIDTGYTFGEFAEYHRQLMTISLRRTQFELALKKKSEKMLIHLGKHYLEQGEKKEEKAVPFKTGIPDNVLIQMVMGGGLNKEVTHKPVEKELIVDSSAEACPSVEELISKAKEKVCQNVEQQQVE